MTFMELAGKRRSVRKYSGERVGREVLDRLAEAVRLAPSASNRQPWRIVFVDEPALREEIAQATFDPLISFNKFVPGAPALAVFVIEAPRLLNRAAASLKKRDLPLIDIGIAAEHFCLEAAEQGLGTCMLGWFDEGRIKKLLGIPKELRLGLVVTIGFPAPTEGIRPRSRKSLDEIRSYNRY
jgi:nitroreductase